MQVVANPLQFLHQGVVNVQTTGGIEYQCIVTLTVGKLTCQPADLNRILISAAVENRNIDLAAEGFKLFNRCRAINVGRNHQGVTLFLAQFERQLATGGGFTRPLQTAKHNRNGRAGSQIQLVVLTATHQQAQFITNDLDHLLTRGQTLQNIMTNSTFTHRSHKVFDHLEVNVCFQQCQADLTHSLLNIVFSQTTTAAKLLEYSIKFFCQVIKHTVISLLPESKRSTLVKLRGLCQAKSGPSKSRLQRVTAGWKRPNKHRLCVDTFPLETGLTLQGLTTDHL